MQLGSWLVYETLDHGHGNTCTGKMCLLIRHCRGYLRMRFKAVPFQEYLDKTTQNRNIEPDEQRRLIMDMFYIQKIYSMDKLPSILDSSCRCTHDDVVWCLRIALSNSRWGILHTEHVLFKYTGDYWVHYIHFCHYKRYPQDCRENSTMTLPR
jgi:hypothetical protein